MGTMQEHLVIIAGVRVWSLPVGYHAGTGGRVL